MKFNRLRLSWQLYPSYLLLIVLVLLTVVWYFSGALRDFHYQQTEYNLAARERLVQPQLIDLFEKSDSPDSQILIRRLGQESSTRITVIRNDGLVLADSHEDHLKMDNHLQRPEIQEALQGLVGKSVRFSNTLGQTLMYSAEPIFIKGKIVGSIRTALPVSNIDATLSAIHQKLLIAGVFFAILLAPICWWLARQMSRPLEQMISGAQRFARGELNTPLEISGSQETTRLAMAMNQMATDLDQRIEIEVSQRNEIEAILGCMVEGIIAVDKQEQVIRLNNAANQMFGVSPTAYAGRNIQEVIREAELQRYIRKALSKKEPMNAELVLFGAKKRYIHFQATPLIGKANEWIGSLIVLHDLTHLRQLESLRRDFVANVSHELKTPITAINSAVETLLEDGPTDPASQQFLPIIFKQNNRLNALVEDLLDLSRIEQGANQGGWDLTNAPLQPVIESAIAACESLIQQQQIEFQSDFSSELMASINPPLLEQAIINLLTNAIKYSDFGGKVVLKAEETTNQIYISVEDYGCGIENKHLTRLFERFYRVDLARSRKLGGTGLGLAIVKHIAQVHQGQIDVKSTPGEGSTFTFRIFK